MKAATRNRPAPTRNRPAVMHAFRPTRCVVIMGDTATRERHAAARTAVPLAQHATTTAYAAALVMSHATRAVCQRGQPAAGKGTGALPNTRYVAATGAARLAHTAVMKDAAVTVEAVNVRGRCAVTAAARLSFPSAAVDITVAGLTRRAAEEVAVPRLLPVMMEEYAVIRERSDVETRACQVRPRAVMQLDITAWLAHTAAMEDAARHTQSKMSRRAGQTNRPSGFVRTMHKQELGNEKEIFRVDMVYNHHGHGNKCNKHSGRKPL